MTAARRALSFALLPLSAMPFVLAAPVLVPAIVERVHELRAEAIVQPGGPMDTVQLTTLEPRFEPPRWAP
jgi:hypothetical protein